MQICGIILVILTIWEGVYAPSQISPKLFSVQEKKAMTVSDDSTVSSSTKWCRKCDQTKQRSEFGSNTGIKDGLHTYCRQCCSTARKAYFERDPDAFRARQRAYWGRPENGRGAKARAWHAANPASALLDRAKRRAAKKGLDFNLTLSDILPLPDVCPVLGIPLRKGNHPRDPNAYSLDRIDNSKGYTAGNVIVMSNRANSLKNDATPEEIHALSRWVASVNKDKVNLVGLVNPVI
jgi:hypothetical protein